MQQTSSVGDSGKAALTLKFVSKSAQRLSLYLDRQIHYYCGRSLSEQRESFTGINMYIATHYYFH